MNLTTKFNKLVLCECRNIARLEDHSGALVCHDCADQMEDEQGYSSIVAWIDYEIKTDN